jgi:hypothetical protein
MLHRQMLEVLGVKNADKLVPLPEDDKPQDPVTENMDVLRNKPIRAFAYQDHEAHMATHQAFMQDPKIMATIGQNPAAQQMVSALMAHIAEHAAFAYRAQIEMALGVPLPALDADANSPISEDDEKALAPLIAAAAQRTMIQNQAMAAQQQQQQQAQDPTLMLQQQELQIRAQEQARKAQKDQVDAQIAQQKMQLEAQRLQLEAQKEQMRLAAQQQTAAMNNAAKDRQNQQKIRADIVKHITKPQPRPAQPKQ